MDRDKPVILRGFTREEEKILIARGVPGQDLVPRKMKIDVSEYLVRIEQNFNYANVPNKVISTGKQLKGLQSILENPLRNSYTVGISSYPSDQRAKWVAQMIMMAACHMAVKGKRPTGKGLPLWHRVYGSLGDPLRDKASSDVPPSMLIIANVNDGSSAVKFEKVRDLLEKFSDIPRIVVSASEPPCNLFANKLYNPMRIGVYIGPPNMVKEV